MSETVYFFDHLQKLIKRKNTRSLIEVSQEKEISSDKSDLMKDTLYVTTKYDKEIEDARYMAIRENESSFSLYRITKVSDPSETLEFTGLGFATNELDAYIIKDIRPSGQPLKNVLDRLIEFTEGNWRVGHVEAMLPAVTATFYYVSVKEALKELQTLGMEFVFRCSLNSDGIKDKWIEVYEQIGEESNTRFVYGSKALTVVREIDRSSISTSMIGRGRGEEVGDGYGRRIEFTDVEWKKSNGDPLDKPKGQNWLEDPEATQKYGIPQKDGSMRKRETVVVFDDIDDPTELLKNTYSTLIDSARPLVQFKAEVTGGDVIGNTVTIHRYDKGYHYKTRIYKTTFNRLTGQTNIELGDNLTQDVRKQTASIVNNINSLESSKMTFYESTEIGKYQDDIMRGAGDNGGSIYWVNGIEAGVSDSREIYETVYMDGPNIPRSRFFMVQNNSGISFKQCKKGEWQTIQDVHNGDSTTAWTLDGTFNANFIMAGILRGILIEGALLKTIYSEGAQKQYQAVMDHGKFLIQDAKDTPDEIDYSNGKWRDQVQGKTIAEFRGTYDAATDRANGAAIIKHKGQIFSINVMGDEFSTPIFQIPADAHADNLEYRLRGTGSFESGQVTFNDKAIFKKGFVEDGQVTFNDKVIFKKGFEVQGGTLFHNNVTMNSNLAVKGGLTINDGQAVYPGQGGGPSGGGGSTGGIPEGLKTDAEKRAWQIYDILLANKFTKQAACGILGNMQQETGGTFDPDTRQIGGPAYGLVQWDGSAYPLVGPPTWDGKLYVQNLFNAANIKEPVESLRGQVQLLLWTFGTSQWMGVIEPSTVAAFKACTDPALAARAFERNYERPAATHPERETYAIQWYNKFKDLKPTQATGEAGLKHLESLVNTRVGNGQCYALSAEYSGFLGGCGMGSGTKYSFSHVIGDTTAASNIGSGYDWGAVGWKVIFNPSLDQLVVGAIINWTQGASVGGPNAWTTDPTYGHTGVIRSIEGSAILTYEQNTEYGQVVAKCVRGFINAGSIASICIPPK